MEDQFKKYKKDDRVVDVGTGIAGTVVWVLENSEPEGRDDFLAGMITLVGLLEFFGMMTARYWR